MPPPFDVSRYVRKAFPRGSERTLASLTVIPWLLWKENTETEPDRKIEDDPNYGCGNRGERTVKRLVIS